MATGKLDQKQAMLRCEYIDEINDIRFGQCQLMKVQQDSLLVLRKDIVADSSMTLKKIQAKLDSLIRNPSIHVVPFLDYGVEIMEQYCASFYKMVYFVVYPEIDLYKQIQKRRMFQVGFTSEELTLLLYGCAFGLSHLAKLQTFHGRLSPKWIMATKAGYALIEEPSDNKYIATPMDRESPDGVYLSPQAYSGTFKKSPAGYDRSKDDIFSLGMILLECGCQTPIKLVYDSKEGKINKMQLDLLLEEFEWNYADNVTLVSAVRKMLEVEEAERPDLHTLCAKLPDLNTVKEYFAKERTLLEANKSASKMHQPPDRRKPYVRPMQMVHSASNDFDDPQGKQVPAQFVPERPNYHHEQQMKKLMKQSRIKSPNRILEVEDHLSQQARKIKERPDDRETTAFFKPERKTEIFLTPGGNFMKKEDKFYETIDENGQKQYKIYVEYELMPPDECEHLYNYYEDQEIMKGHDQNFNLKTTSPIQQTVYLGPDPPSKALKSPLNSRGYTPYIPPVNQKETGSGLTRPTLGHPSMFTGRNFMEQDTLDAESMYLSNYIEKPLQETGSQGFAQFKPPWEKPKPELQRIEIDGVVYEGYVTEDDQGNQFLAVDTDKLQSAVH